MASKRELAEEAFQNLYTNTPGQVKLMFTGRGFTDADIEGLVIPDTVTHVSCENNKLTKLPNLPNGLKHLNCGYNAIVLLPDPLPPTLEYLACNDNQLDSLPELPSGLKTLNCSGNRITQLPKLPNGLETLFANYNRIAKLPIIPKSVIKFAVNENPFVEPYAGILRKNKDNLRMIIQDVENYNKVVRKIGRQVIATENITRNLPQNVSELTSSYLTGIPGSTKKQKETLKRMLGGKKGKTRRRRTLKKKQIR